MIVSRTPFRISFFGGGTDFPEWYNENYGQVISMAIDKYCYISLRRSPFAEYNYNIRYRKIELVNKLSEIEHPSVRYCFKDFNCQNKKLEMIYYADIPGRSGIGSSSSFTVGLLNSLYSLNNLNPSKKKLALKAINIEQNLIKEHVGSQDQVISAFGGFNTIKFSKKNIKVEEINMSASKKKLLTNSLVLLFTGYSRLSTDITFHHKKNLKKNKSKLNEIYSLTKEVNNSFNNNNLDIRSFAKNLNYNWLIKRKLSKFVTNEKIDTIYNKAMKNGALGGKLLGAGGGGFLCFVVDPQYKTKFIKKFSKLLHVPFNIDDEGSKIIYKKL